MEIKKSSKADLEGGRVQRFLLGLVIALSCLFVALEYTLTPDDPLSDTELLQQLTMDEELPPLMRPENQLVLAPKPKPEPSTKLKIVEEEEVKEEKQPPQQPEEQMESDTSEDELPNPEEENKNEGDEIMSLRVVEDLPQFPGGPLEFIKWLTRNLKYPPQAQRQRQQGKVVAEFIVNKDGSVTDVRIVQSLNPACDHEALRVLRNMPRWTAGVINDKPCRTKVCIPIVFKL